VHAHYKEEKNKYQQKEKHEIMMRNRTDRNKKEKKKKVSTMNRFCLDRYSMLHLKVVSNCQYKMNKEQFV
jgi:hypothetical protein